MKCNRHPQSTSEKPLNSHSSNFHFHGPNVAESRPCVIYDIVWSTSVSSSQHVLKYLFLSLFLHSNSALTYIALLLSCRNCLDSHLARVCHPFVILTEGGTTAQSSGQQQNQLARNDICQILPLERSSVP